MIWVFTANIKNACQVIVDMQWSLYVICSVNIHGESTSHISGHEVEGLETLGISTMENLSLSINPEFGKHFGNPSSSETDTTSSESYSDSR
jgi:hypothetical protein